MPLLETYCSAAGLEGLFGYFPSCLMVHLISAQLSEVIQQTIGPLEDCVVRGDEHQLLAWLREHVHPIGRMMNAEQLVERVTGKPLSSKPFLDYLEDKLKQLQEL